MKKITFQGNRAFPESELKGLMGTKEEWFLSFVTKRGVLDHDVPLAIHESPGLHPVTPFPEPPGR